MKYQMKFGPDEIRKAKKQLLSIKNRLEDIQIVIDNFEEFAQLAKLEQPFVLKMSIVLDELLANVVRYAFEDDHDHLIYLEFVVTDSSFYMTLEDDGVPFDPFNQPPPDTGKGLEERDIGGLGIHIVKSLMDSYSYERLENNNVVKLEKHDVVRDN
jgi:sigma-B regulation protein RsbU (phosphoserine phosphatase)